ncbi:MAG: hypothetical protein JWN46_3718 [Acidimicrobiales bacterium]|nr:hypothetical protein [Acidimicrobiales bacterium]
MRRRSAADRAGTARLFTAHEPDACRRLLDLATGAVPDHAALLRGDVDEPGVRPQLKERAGQLRLRPPRRLGGVLTVTSLIVGLRRDDGGGTIIETTRRRPLWTRLVALPPLLLAVLLVVVAVVGHQWGVLVVAVVALALALAVPRALVGAGDTDALRLVRFVTETCDAVRLDEDEDEDEVAVDDEDEVEFAAETDGLDAPQPADHGPDHEPPRADPEPDHEPRAPGEPA